MGICVLDCILHMIIFFFIFGQIVLTPPIQYNPTVYCALKGLKCVSLLMDQFLFKVARV